MTNNNETRSRGLVSLGAVAAVAMALAVSPTAATAATVVFDFGTLGANGGAVCGSNCVLPNGAETTFTTGGVTTGALGFTSTGAGAYVTQKPGAFGASGGEAGLGESNTRPGPSSSDYEVTPSTYLLVDNSQALAAGYRTTSISIGSIQNGEGAKVYAYSGALNVLALDKLTLLSTISAPATGGVTQAVGVPSLSKYLVIQAYVPANGAPASDIVLAREVLTSGAVPEPASWAMMLVGFGGLGAVARRKRVADAV